MANDEEEAEYEPPYRLCALILAAVLVGGAVFAWKREEGRIDRATAAVSALSDVSGELTQVIRLKQVYSQPLPEEDPSLYPSLDQKNGQKSPSDRRPE